MSEEPEKRNKQNYIDNKVFYAALLERRELVDQALLDQVKDDPDEYKRRLAIIEYAKSDEDINRVRKKGDTSEQFKLLKYAKKNGLVVPQVTNYIGECFIKIAENFSKIQNSKHSYYRYSFKDEMIADAIVNCLRYVDSFDARRGKNPFSFFTTCVWHSFVFRIQKERMELATKQKMIKTFDVSKISVQGHDDVDMVNDYIEQIKSYMTGIDYSEYFDSKRPESKRKRKTKAEKELSNPLLDYLYQQNDDISTMAIDSIENDII